MGPYPTETMKTFCRPLNRARSHFHAAAAAMMRAGRVSAESGLLCHHQDA